MVTEYVMRAYKTTVPVGHVYWTVIGSADMTGAQSGYNPSDLTDISVDYTTETPLVGNPITPTGLAGGDLNGTYPNPVVRKLQTRAVSQAAPSDGYVLTWDQVDGYWVARPSAGGTPSGAAGGDLSGTFPNPTVSKIQGRTVNSAAPTTGQALVWNAGGFWIPQTLTTSGSAGGDLSGTFPNPTVVRIQNYQLSTTAPTDGYVLTWEQSNNYWIAKPTSLTSATTSQLGDIKLSGDLGGTATSVDVLSIHGATVPAAGSLPVGSVLKVSGASALTYGALDLAGGPGVVTGILPVVNQSPQAMIGDVSGSTDANTVTKIQNRNVSSVAPDDGYVLTWVAANSDWEPKESSGGGGGGSPTGSAGGDLASTYPNPTVAKIRGTSVSSTAPTDGQVLGYVAANSRWEPVTETNDLINKRGTWSQGSIHHAVSGAPKGVLGVGNNLWVSYSNDDEITVGHSVAKFDVSNTLAPPVLSKVISVNNTGNGGTGPGKMAYDGTHIWMLTGGTLIEKINESTGEVTDVVDLIAGYLGGTGIAYAGDGYIWVSDNQNLFKIDIVTNLFTQVVTITPTEFFGAFSDLLLADGFMWANAGQYQPIPGSGTNNGSIIKFDLAGNLLDFYQGTPPHQFGAIAHDPILNIVYAPTLDGASEVILMIDVAGASQTEFAGDATARQWRSATVSNSVLWLGGGSLTSSQGKPYFAGYDVTTSTPSLINKGIVSNKTLVTNGACDVTFANGVIWYALFEDTAIRGYNDPNSPLGTFAVAINTKYKKVDLSNPESVEISASYTGTTGSVARIISDTFGTHVAPGAVSATEILGQLPLSNLEGGGVQNYARVGNALSITGAEKLTVGTVPTVVNGSQPSSIVTNNSRAYIARLGSKDIIGLNAVDNILESTSNIVIPLFNASTTTATNLSKPWSLAIASNDLVANDGYYIYNIDQVHGTVKFIYSASTGLYNKDILTIFSAGFAGNWIVTVSPYIGQTILTLMSTSEGVTPITLDITTEIADGNNVTSICTDGYFIFLGTNDSKIHQYQFNNSGPTVTFVRTINASSTADTIVAMKGAFGNIFVANQNDRTIDKINTTSGSIVDTSAPFGTNLILDMTIDQFGGFGWILLDELVSSGPPALVAFDFTTTGFPQLGTGYNLGGDPRHIAVENGYINFGNKSVLITDYSGDKLYMADATVDSGTATTLSIGGLVDWLPINTASLNGGTFGGQTGILQINLPASGVPTTPTSGYYMYVDPVDGKLKIIGSSGTITTIAIP